MQSIVSSIGNLGDNLWLLPLAKHGKKLNLFDRIIMPDDPRCKEVSRIFDNILPVEFGNPTFHQPETKDRIHRAKAHLDFLDIKESAIPELVFSEEEINWGLNFVSKYHNPIAVNFSTMNNGGDFSSSQRVLSDDLISFIVDNLSKNYSLLNFGLSHNSRHIDNVESIFDLDIRKMASAYRAIGKYVGSESGPPHLMIASGGKSLVFHPSPSDIYYPSWKYHFTEEYFPKGECRTKYVLKDNMAFDPSIFDFLK